MCAYTRMRACAFTRALELACAQMRMSRFTYIFEKKSETITRSTRKQEARYYSGKRWYLQLNQD